MLRCNSFGSGGHIFRPRNRFWKNTVEMQQMWICVRGTPPVVSCLSFLLTPGVYSPGIPTAGLNPAACWLRSRPPQKKRKLKQPVEAGGFIFSSDTPSWAVHGIQTIFCRYPHNICRKRVKLWKSDSTNNNHIYSGGKIYKTVQIKYCPFCLVKPELPRWKTVYQIHTLETSTYFEYADTNEPINGPIGLNLSHPKTLYFHSSISFVWYQQIPSKCGIWKSIAIFSSGSLFTLKCKKMKKGIHSFFLQTNKTTFCIYLYFNWSVYKYKV